jgi:hypothetical protein
MPGANNNFQLCPNLPRGGNREPQVSINAGIRVPWDKEVHFFQGTTMPPKKIHPLIKSAWLLVNSYLKYLAHDPPFLPQA